MFREEENTYTIELECTNCGESEEFEIPKGKLVIEYYQNLVCSNCGCKSMKKYSEDEE